MNLYVACQVLEGQIPTKRSPPEGGRGETEAKAQEEKRVRQHTLRKMSDARMAGQSINGDQGLPHAGSQGYEEGQKVRHV